MSKGLALSLILLLIFVSAGDASTLKLMCSYGPAADSFFAQIQFSHERVTSIRISKGGWCDSRDGQVTEKEISFPCAFELAGRRISFSFTLDRLSGAFEQRFFVGGKLQQVHHGSCTLKSVFD
jgi:hypothetical protein